MATQSTRASQEAGGSLKVTGEVIICPECHKIYEDPKELRCYHVFCRACLEQLLARSQSQQNIKCPTCRLLTGVPREGVSNLRSSESTINLLEIHSNLRDLRASNTIQTGTAPKSNMCPKHESSELQLLCKRCHVVMCFQCTLKDHKDHEFEMVSDIIDRHKEELESFLRPIEERTAGNKQVLAELGWRYGEVFSLRDNIEQNINAYFDQCQHILNARRRLLISRVQEVTKEKEIVLAREKGKRESMHAQLCGSADLLKEALTTKNSNNLEMFQNIVHLVRRTTREIDDMPEETIVDTEINVEAALPPDLPTTLNTAGEILIPDPVKCNMSGPGLEYTEVGQASVVTMAVYTSKDEPFRKPLKVMESELTFQDESRMKCEIKKREDNVYKIHYMPTLRGKHLLHIKINHRHIKGSPFPIIARLPVKSLARP